MCEKELHSNQKDEVKPYVPSIPFPQRLKAHKFDKDFEKFLEMFKELQLDIPFIEAIAHMPNYAKFLKDIVSNKKKLEEYATVALTKKCGAVFQNKLPSKLKDLMSFTTQQAWDWRT